MTTTEMGLERAEGELLTIDELAAAVGVTVRTTRYYATLGLVPPPVMRGRTGYYGPEHRARLELVRALQDHGFTLAAIERFVADLPEGAGADELALRRALLMPWTTGAPTVMDRDRLVRAAGRPLSERDLQVLEMTGAITPAAPEGAVARWTVAPHLSVSVELLDVDVPVESLGLAEAAISRHMESLADELTDILRAQVLEPYRRAEHAPEDAARLEQTMGALRRLTLEAVVNGFQRAANDVITRSVLRS